MALEIVYIRYSRIMRREYTCIPYEQQERIFEYYTMLKKLDY